MATRRAARVVLFLGILAVLVGLVSTVLRRYGSSYVEAEYGEEITFLAFNGGLWRPGRYVRLEVESQPIGAPISRGNALLLTRGEQTLSLSEATKHLMESWGFACTSSPESCVYEYRNGSCSAIAEFASDQMMRFTMTCLDSGADGPFLITLKGAPGAVRLPVTVNGLVDSLGQPTRIRRRGRD